MRSCQALKQRAAHSSKVSSGLPTQADQLLSALIRAILSHTRGGIASGNTVTSPGLLASGMVLRPGAPLNRALHLPTPLAMVPRVTCITAGGPLKL